MLQHGADAALFAETAELIANIDEGGGLREVKLEHHHVVVVVAGCGKIEDVDALLGAKARNGGDKSDAICAAGSQNVGCFWVCRVDRGCRSDWLDGDGAVGGLEGVLDGFGRNLIRKSHQQNHREVAAQQALAQVGNVALQLTNRLRHAAHNPHFILGHDRNHKLMHRARIVTMFDGFCLW